MPDGESAVFVDDVFNNVEVVPVQPFIIAACCQWCLFDAFASEVRDAKLVMCTQ